MSKDETPSWLPSLARKHRKLLLSIATSSVGLTLLLFLWRHIVSALSVLPRLFQWLRQDITVELWLVLALPMLTLLLLILVQYFRQYRYSSGIVFGLDFTWFYLTPFGRICRVRAFCPVCHKLLTEPTLIHIPIICSTCDQLASRTYNGPVEYPWHDAIQRRVYEQLYKPPAA